MYLMGSFLASTDQETYSKSSITKSTGTPSLALYKSSILPSSPVGSSRACIHKTWSTIRVSGWMIPKSSFQTIAITNIALNPFAEGCPVTSLNQTAVHSQIVVTTDDQRATGSPIHENTKSRHARKVKVKVIVLGSENKIRSRSIFHTHRRAENTREKFEI